MLVSGGVVSLQNVLHIVSMAVALVFGYAAFAKLADFRSVVAAIHDYEMIPAQIAPLVAVTLISAESGIALAHISGVGLGFVIPGTIAMLSIFLIVVAKALRQGEKRPCLCFGASREDLVDASTLARIAVLLLAELAMVMNFDIYVAVAGRNTSDFMLEVSISALSVILVAGCFALPNIRRAIHVVRS